MRPRVRVTVRSNEIHDDDKNMFVYRGRILLSYEVLSATEEIVNFI